MRKKILLAFVFLFLAHAALAYAAKPTHAWVRTNPGGGGAISMVGATKSGVMIAASDLSGIYRSNDHGASWTPLGANNGLINSGVNSLGFHATDGNTFYIGSYLGLYKTVDGGNTIYQAKLETKRQPNAQDPSKADGLIEAIGMSFSKPSVGYLAHYEDWAPELTFMKTSDAGESWKIVKTTGIPPKARILKIVVDYKDSETIYVVTGKARFGCGPAELYKSTDGGKSWEKRAGDVGKEAGINKQDESDILDIDLDPSNPDKLYISTFKAGKCIDSKGNEVDYAATENSEFENYIIGADKNGNGIENVGAVYQSTDAGLSFTALQPKDNNGNIIKGVTGILSVDRNSPHIVRVVEILHPYDWNEKAGTWELDSNNPEKSTHAGLIKNWKRGYAKNQYAAFAPSFFGLNKTLSKDLFNSNNFYGSFGQWAWASFDAGKTLNNVTTKPVGADTWRSTGVENITGHVLDVNDADPNIIYMGGYDIGFWASQDHGLSWTRYQPDWNHKNNKNVYDYRLYSWDIGGLDYDQKPPKPIDVDPDLAQHGSGSNISTLLSDPKKASTVWASFSREQYAGQDGDARTGLFKSTDFGKTWELIHNGLPAINTSLKYYGLSIDPQSPVGKRTLFLSVDNDIYTSTDDGESWKKVLDKSISGGLKFTQVDHKDKKLIYAGGEGGLWRSQDGGTKWQQIGGTYKKEMQGNYPGMRDDIIPTDPIRDDNDKITTQAWEGVFDIKTDPNHKNRVYVTAFGKGKGLYRSDDAGITFKKLLTDDHMRGVAIAPQDSNIVYATSSESYYSGANGNSLGIQFSADAGNTWQDANDGMAWNYGGMIEIEAGTNPNVWAWSPGTGVQYSPVAKAFITDTDKDGLPDAWEDANGLDKNDPLDALQDSDLDGLNNLQEYQHNTNPKQRDTDGDGATDGDEIHAGTDPLDANSKPVVANIPSSSTWSLIILSLLLYLSFVYRNRQLTLIN